MRASHGALHRWVWTAFLVLMSAQFAIAYQWEHKPFLRLPLYAAGGERLPYQARVLMAWVLRAAVGLHGTSTLARHAPEQLRDPYTFVLTLTSFACMVVAVLATKRTLHLLTGSAAYARWSALLVLFMSYFNLVMPYGLNYTLPYDVPSLMFFAVALMLLVERRWYLFYPVFVLGTLNRETFCFVAVFFLVWRATELRAEPVARRVRAIAPHIFAQAALWICIKLWLRRHFAANALEDMESGLFHIALLHNLKSTLNPGQWPLLFSLFGGVWPLLIAGRRHIGHEALRRAASVVVPLWIVGMYVVGVVVEVRVFNELTAILALVAAMEAWNLWFRPAFATHNDAVAAAVGTA